MISIKQTTKDDIVFIEGCLRGKDEKFVEQCGYGSRFFTYPITYDQILKFQKETHPDSIFFTIFLDDNRIGTLELMLEHAERECSIARFLIADHFRFKGYGTKALHKIIEYSFDTLQYNKISICVFDFNKSAQKCYEKAGFKIARNEIRSNGYAAIYMEVMNPSL